MDLQSHHKEQRQFPYKEPQFGSEKRPKPVKFWQGTVYYMWWQYLKRNDGYLVTCESGGEGIYSSTYADFGDVRGDDFKDWWSRGGRGIRLFAEPRVKEEIRILGNGESALSDEEMLTLVIPLNLQKRFIETRIKEILSERHRGKRGIQYAKKSKAKYKIQGQPNVPALTLGLRVYDYWKAHPEMAQWEIGNELPLFQMEHKIRRGDTQAVKTSKKNILTATVSRYLKRAKATIEKAGYGEFP